MSRLRFLGLALAFAASGALAQDVPQDAPQDAPVVLSGTLAKARTTGVVTLAARTASIPFSYLSPGGEPIGYSIEICHRIVEAMSQSVGRELSIRWIPVTPETRIRSIESGDADLECGSTTSNAERAKRVSFSPTIFVSGTKLLVKRGSPIHSFSDLSGKTVVVTSGTTNEETMHEIARKFSINYRVQVARDHAESFTELAQGRVDAFATDDVLLYGLVAHNRVSTQYLVVGDFLSYDPYGIMYRKGDPEMRTLVEDTFRRLAQDGEIERQYKRWFMQRLPYAEPALGLPMSPQLETFLRAMRERPE